jgi:Tol biopolymer transport system component
MGMSGIKPTCSLVGLTLAALLLIACANQGTQSLYDVIAPPDTIVAGFSDFNSEIYTIAPHGGRLTRITDTPGHVESEPVWSPDGRLAFVRAPFFMWTQEELIVASADGNDPVSVAGGMDISQPAWSPDGSRIAFVEGAINLAYEDVLSCPQTGFARLFLADVATATNGPLLDLVAPDGCPILSTPQWSPDGSRIALASRGVYLVDVASGSLTELVAPTDAVAVAWSPDGQRLAVTAAPTDGEPSGRVLVVGADGQGLTEIARENDWIHSLAWSPQDDLIAFAAGADEGQLSVVNPDGGGPRSLAQGVKGGLTWAPDCQRLAVGLSGPSSLLSSGVPNIYAVDIDGGATTRLTDVDAWEYSPAWSPDGSAIAFVSRRDAQSGVFAVHVDGSFTPLIPTHSEPPQAFLGPDRRVIAPAEAFVETEYVGGKWPLAQGTISPDGRHLANLVSTADMLSEGCSGDVQDIYTRDVDGSEITNVTNTPDVHEMEVAWSPDSRLLALTSGAPPRCHFIPSRLEVMNADGSERRLLADFSSSQGQVDTPRWIGGGSALLFHVTHLGPGQGFGAPAGNPELYTVNVDGSDLRRVYEPVGADFQWLLSPDGERLAIFEMRMPKGWRMLLGDVDGTGMEEVARAEGDLSQLQWLPAGWSPDGARLAFSECRGDPCEMALLVVNTDGSGVRTLLDAYTAFEPLAWFPDGSRLAIVTHPDPCRVGEGVPPGHLEVVDVEGGAPQRLTDRCVVRWVLGWSQQ